MTSHIISDRLIAWTALTMDEFDALIDLERKYDKGAINPTTFMVRANKVLPPAKWQTFMLSIATPELRNVFRGTKQHKALVKAAEPPKGFSIDVLHSMRLPYRHLGRLAATCRWMRLHITEKMLREAFGRVKAVWGSFEAIGAAFRFMSSDEDVIELKHIGENLFRLRVNGVLYVANGNLYVKARSHSFVGGSGRSKGFLAIGMTLCNMFKQIDDGGRISAVISERSRSVIEMELAVVDDRCPYWRASQKPDDLEYTVTVRCILLD